MTEKLVGSRRYENYDSENPFKQEKKGRGRREKEFRESQKRNFVTIHEAQKSRSVLRDGEGGNDGKKEN